MFHFLFLAATFLSTASGQEPNIPANAEIVVEAHRNTEVYVAPVTIVDKSDRYDVNVSDDILFGYISTHSKMAQVPSKYGWVNIGNSIAVYNKDTINYAWDNCDYSRDYMKCSSQNGHYFVKTIVTVTDHQVQVSIQVFDQYLQVQSTGNVSNNYSISYVDRNKVTQKSSCSPGTCPSILAPTVPQTQTVVEELPPEKIEIHPKLLSKDLHQASMRAFVGLKIQ